MPIQQKYIIKTTLLTPFLNMRQSPHPTLKFISKQYNRQNHNAWGWSSPLLSIRQLFFYYSEPKGNSHLKKIP